jgi:subtilisin family serine protease
MERTEEGLMTGTRYRKTLGIALGILVVAFLLVGCAAARPAGTEFYKGREVAPHEVIVKFRDAAPQALGQAVAGQDVDEAEQVGSAHAVRLHSRSKDVGTLIRELSARSDVEYVEPNYVVHAVKNPNDPLYSSLWGLPKIGAPQAWDLTTGSPSLVVAVVDTGFDYNHPDLTGNAWSAPADFQVTVTDPIYGTKTISCAQGTHGYNAITDTCIAMDDAGHGTHVSGTIGAMGNNGIGVTGVNWGIKVMGAKFLDSTGSGYLNDGIEAIDFVIKTKLAFKDTGGANVIALSNSWAGGGYSQALSDEIELAREKGILFVAAAGNSASNNDNTPVYPASYTNENVIAVAATDSLDNLATFSCYGAGSVDLGAPGVNIYSTTPGGKYAYMSGTSMATPHVSGAVALVASACPALDAAQLRTTILANVDPVASLSGKTVTGGRLNVYKAIQACTVPRTPTTTTLTVNPVSPSSYGVPVTLTASVSPAGAFGTVTFSEGSSSLGTGTLSNGAATLTTSALAGGMHSLAATYGGDATYAGSTSAPVSYTVNPAGTTTTLVSLAKTDPYFGEPVTFEARVVPGTATGMVSFTDGQTLLGTTAINPVYGTADFTTSTLSAGSHAVMATYGGDVNYLGSTSGIVTQEVLRAASITSLTSGPNPSSVGQQVTFTATVTPASAVGTVNFMEGVNVLGTGTLSGGKATFLTSGLSAGSHQVTASYPGNSDVAGSTSPAVTQVVTSTPSPDFTIMAAPPSRTISPGSRTTYAVTITRISGFSKTIYLSVSGLPSGATGSFSPSYLSGSRTTSTLTVRTGSRTPVGSSTLSIRGTGGSLVHTTTVALVVTKTGSSSRGH